MFYNLIKNVTTFNAQQNVTQPKKEKITICNNFTVHPLFQIKITVNLMYIAQCTMYTVEYIAYKSVKLSLRTQLTQISASLSC